MKSESFLLYNRKSFPMGNGAIEEVLSPKDIRPDECTRAIDGTIDMRLCREVNDGIRLVTGQ